MARRGARMILRGDRHDGEEQRRKLQHLVSEVHAKFDELNALLQQEEETLRMPVTDPVANHLLARQQYLDAQSVEACVRSRQRAIPQSGAAGGGQFMQGGAVGGPVGATAGGTVGSVSGGPTGGAFGGFSLFKHPKPPAVPKQGQSSKSGKEPSNSEGSSSYGSLDRSIAKKKKQLFDKRRRHTKTIGSMAGLEVIKKSSELKPDEQYEIGLPTPPRVAPPTNSVFLPTTEPVPDRVLPMTQHQYYTALMESRLNKTVAYPLDVRQSRYQYPPVGVHPTSSIMPTNYHLETLDENKNMHKKQEYHSILRPPTLLLPPTRSSGNEYSVIAPTNNQVTRRWAETSLDETTPHPVIVQNPSPSPSMLSSTRGSSRGSAASDADTVDSVFARMAVSSPGNKYAEYNNKGSESGESWSGAGNEVTKPFEMADYYKYSTKYRSSGSPLRDDSHHTSHMIAVGPSSAVSHVSHSRQLSQSQSFDGKDNFGDSNGNSAVGPKLPPKQNRQQNKNMNGDTGTSEGETANGDSGAGVWMTNKPTFV